MSGASRWRSIDGASYDAKWQAMADRGVDPHGEVAFVQRFDPASALDAGCGTGRVAIELHRRGVSVVGVDVDEVGIGRARDKAPDIEWHLTDLSRLDLRDAADEQRIFDVVVMAGNVMIFVAPGTEGRVLERCAAHVAPDGVLVAGFQLGRGLDLQEYDRLAAATGLELVGRYATWDGDSFAGGDYAVSVHRR